MTHILNIQGRLPATSLPHLLLALALAGIAAALLPIGVEAQAPNPDYEIQGLGPVIDRVIEEGALDAQRLEGRLNVTGTPLTDRQSAILQGRNRPVAITPDNAAFLLYTLWATGLLNRNNVLVNGPMLTATSGGVGRMASVGGWVMGMEPATALYARERVIPLSDSQQARLERVARNVFRPCCDNSTYFPDCNHGMAMLGLLTHVASQGATEAELLKVAEAANAVWYPEQTLHARIYASAQGLDEPGAVVSRPLLSGSGHGRVRSFLRQNDLLADGGNSLSC